MRVVISDDKRFSVILNKSVNAKIKTIAEEVEVLIDVPKYGLTFFYQGEKLSFGDTIGDRGIGGPTGDSGHFLLCLKGGDEGPKCWKRFTTVDDPCRQLSYISDDESFDAITFVPNRDIVFVGFSVYHVASTDVDFRCIYKYKVGTERSQELTAHFSQADVHKKMAKIMLDEEIPVDSGKPITIMVRFLAGDEYFCSTLLGYGGESYREISENGEDMELFEIRETEDCTKFETDSKFG